MEPVTATMALAAVNTMGSVLRPNPLVPTNATSGMFDGGGGMDSSGWNVTFGNNSGIEASRQESAAMSNTMTYVLIAVGGLIAWKLVKKL